MDEFFEWMRKVQDEEAYIQYLERDDASMSVTIAAFSEGFQQYHEVTFHVTDVRREF